MASWGSALWGSVRYWLGFGWLSRMLGHSPISSSKAAAARPYTDFSTPEAEALRTKHREATDAVNDVQRQISDLQGKLANDYGPNGRFEPLSRECYTSALGGEWNYEICPFKNAAQKGQSGGSTSIGNWEGFADDYTTLKFTNGQMCWNGPSRSLTVTLVCAGENKVLAVDEPEVCKYTMRFQTPAACTQAQLDAAQAEVDGLAPERVHDEL